ncbi:hypothetical protein PV08_01591 [Exophiala spinifera]|uniref:Uncharacterized protein n=1 Tax=Exophiala spinifera TaxID=91928 RepID=A0A0D2A8D7_9EURO|nr:uncharacterized protein PV08_01591 [Exophiala spinifera]KIW21012.1 hypothetical protein PV08_01591 [Exophiala spinifera]
MADALDPATSVHQGFWKDWSKDGIQGLTWTLSPTNAIILTNSLTLFVTIISVQLWTIIRYTLHQTGATSPPEMTPHLRSEQVILRNAGSDLATAQHMLSLAWKSRRISGKRSLRSYGIGFLALIYAVIFMLSGIFSNRAISSGSTNGGSAVLVTSKYCGVWNDTYFAIATGGFSNQEELQLNTQWVAKVAHDIQLSLQYAQECYFSQSSNMLVSARSATSNATSSRCNSLKSPSLGWDTRKGSCPFKEQTCHQDSKTIVLDTGDIDSHMHLGINAPPSQRLTYRRNTTCAVLDDKNYITGWDGSVTNTSSPNPGQKTAYANYGPSLYKSTNWTYSYTNFASFYNNFSSQVTAPYLVDPERAYAFAEPQWSTSDFAPVAEVAQTDADLTLLFLSFIGMYLGEVNDPWFSAHEAQLVNTSTPFLNQRYLRDEAISTIGCTEQHQFCTHNGTCTGFLGFDQVQNVKEFNDALTPHQNATFDRMLRAVAFSLIAHVVENLGVTTTSMLATSVTKTGSTGAVISEPLPDDQWETELQYWHSVAMAQLQRGMAEWATGQIAPSPQYVQYLLPPTAEQDVWFCKSMIIPSTFYQSFSVLAIMVIVILGTVIIVLGFTIENLAACVRSRLRKSPPRGDWEHDDMLRRPTSGIGLNLSRTTRRDRHPSMATRESTFEKDFDSLMGLRPSTNRRISSQVLAPTDPAFGIVNYHTTSSFTGKSKEMMKGFSFRLEEKASMPSNLVVPFENPRKSPSPP